jgi:urease accessory protein
MLFPRPEPDDLPVAALLTTSGGLAGGDRLRLEFASETRASVLATTAAAEKVYGSLGPDTRVDIGLTVEDGAWLEWLPQETILFDGARLVRRVNATLAPGGRLLAAELVVFGRRARGERFAKGLLHEAWRIRVGEKLVWADAMRLEGDIAAQIDAPAAFAGAGAMATVVYVGADAADHLDLARSHAEAGLCEGGATVVNGVLLARFLAPRGETLRRAVIDYVAGLRQATAGLPPRMPRLWHT